MPRWGLHTLDLRMSAAKSRKGLLLLLLLLLAVRPSQEQIEGTIEVLSAMGEALVGLPHVEYTVEILVDTSDVEHLRSLHNAVVLPAFISDKQTYVTSLNTTTVCIQTTTGFQCECEDTFFWPSTSCMQYGSCGESSADCTCITSLPADGVYCQPRIEITVEIEVGIPVSMVMASEVVNITRQQLEAFLFPFQPNKTVLITDVNLTTVCYSDTSGSQQCRCEDQYGWSCDQCVTYGTCSSNTTTALCACINKLPSDGQLCQPITRLSPCPTTTTPPPTPPTTTISPTTTTTPTTTPTPTTPPPTTTTISPTTTPTTTPTPTTPPPTGESRNFSLTIESEFEEAFNQPDNTFFKTINESIQSSSKKVFDSLLLSTTFLGLRAGSVIAEFIVSINGPFEAQKIQSLQDGIATTLVGTYDIITTPALRFLPADVFVGDTVKVSCGRTNETIPGLDMVEWTVNREQRISRHTRATEGQDATLTIKPLFSIDTGYYRCHKDSFQQTGFLDVKPTPRITLTPIRKNVKCQLNQDSTVDMMCCVQDPYQATLMDGSIQLTQNSNSEGCNSYIYSTTCGDKQVELICQEKDFQQFNKTSRLKFFTQRSQCDDDVFGEGRVGDNSIVGCEEDEVGFKSAFCQTDGKWGNQTDNCVLSVLSNLLFQSQFLDSSTLPNFLEDLNTSTVTSAGRVVESPNNVRTIVNIFTAVSIASLFTPISKILMESILDTMDVVVGDDARETWVTLNNNVAAGNGSSVIRELIQTRRASSAFLASIETISEALTDDEDFNITTRQIILNRNRLPRSFSADLNSSVVLNLPGPHQDNSFITTINFNSLNNVLPPINATNDNSSTINGNVVLVKSNSSVNNVTLIFDIDNTTLKSPHCVFWNFSLLDNKGAWDSTGCMVTSMNQTTVTCICNHLTSFSILMSPFSPDLLFLDFITYIGVGISMASLVICLIIEAIVWRKIHRNSTSYLRHVCIVNIAVSLLIANIWFIIGAAVSEAEQRNPPACSAATFFIHFFYLSMFFWMLMSGLLLLYRTIRVFQGGMSDGTLLAVGFSMGYGAPLIIAVITIAVTAPRGVYTREEEVCWLNWNGSKALLAFVIPALSIVFINLLILVVVLYKMLRSRGVGNSDRSTLLVIVRSLAVLTPFFGTTWGLGVGTMTNPRNIGIHVAFAVFNSLQGFFILVFGSLLDGKVRSALKVFSSAWTTGTQSTSAGNSSSSGPAFQHLWGRRRGGYQVSSGAPTSTS